MKKRLISLLLVLTITFTLTSVVFATNTDKGLAWDNIYVPALEESSARINMQYLGSAAYLFLPASVSPSAVPLCFEAGVSDASYTVSGTLKAVAAISGEPVDLNALCGESSVYHITVTATAGEEHAELKLMVIPTGEIASMFLISDDPANEGRAWVESSPDKTNKATGTMLMTNSDGSVVYDGALTQIKGRGNSTWLQNKKPYQIKLKDKTDLLETDDKDNKSKTWVLLANAADGALIRNNIVYDLSIAMGMDAGVQCRPVNLYYDGEYRGAYLLCEKVEVGSGRVDIEKLEDLNEEANPDVEDFDDLTTATGKTENGATYIYCEGMASPADITGGYLLEMDTAARATAEKCYFITRRNQYVVVKEPEYCSAEEMDYIASYYQEFEDAIYSGGYNEATEKHLSEYASIDSIAQCYIINELTKNPDGYRTSSYLYKDANTDVMAMGPVWDYDLSFGIGWGDFTEPCKNPEEFFTLRSKLGLALYEIPEFRVAVHDIYAETVAPLIRDTLTAAGSQSNEAGTLKSVGYYKEEIYTAALANAILWGSSESWWSANVSSVESYIIERNTWLTEIFSTWNAESAEPLAGFVDVKSTDWFYDSVTLAASYGLMSGVGNAIFSPNGKTTRAQAATVLFFMSGDEEPAARPIFKDADHLAWYGPYITWAYENEVIAGYGDGNFGTNDNITRQDLVCLLYRFVGSPEVEGSELDSFTDAGKVADYARDAVEWAIENKILTGYEDNSVRPLNHITRAELATLCVNFYETFVMIKDAQ